MKALVRLPNVIATSHIVGATCDRISHQSSMIGDSIEAWLHSDRPGYLVNTGVLETAAR
jgi:phosphoglycerate dehydrogenase-like enzyme